MSDKLICPICGNPTSSYIWETIEKIDYVNCMLRN